MVGWNTDSSTNSSAVNASGSKSRSHWRAARGQAMHDSVGGDGGWGGILERFDKSAASEHGAS